MHVIKRNGNSELFQFDKISVRINKLIDEAGLQRMGKIINDDETTTMIDTSALTQQIVIRLYSGIKTSEIDDLAAQIAMDHSIGNPNLAILASRLVVSNHQKETLSSFTKVVLQLLNNTDKKGSPAPLVSDELVNLAKTLEADIEEHIDLERDYLFDYFGFKTLARSYLLKTDGKIRERPQHLFMRVALGIHGDDWESVKKTYDSLSLRKYTHATPTLFNAGTPRPQMSSCFLLGTEDSIEGIFKSITDCAKISKWAGGIGLHISNIRGEGSYIRKTGGDSTGIMPLLKVLNDTARYINQGGKRNGSFAIYLEPWHSDIFSFLDAKKNQGQEEERARDLFYALWIPDLFMKKVETNADWCLMCPDECPGLSDVYGDEFEKLYEFYESEHRYKKKVNARDVWSSIILSQVETGGPYICYKDSVNQKSNQKNLGVIKSSNLCVEINIFSNEKETGVCNLASICLPSFLKFPKIEYSLVEIYTKPNCVYCLLVKQLLRERGCEFLEITKKQAEQYHMENPLPLTVPQIFIDCVYFGGYEELWQKYKPVVDYEELKNCAGELTQNLNLVIDKNFYPTEEGRLSNMNHRPIGIGVQGLADLFIKLRLDWESEEARQVNRCVFETIYYGAMTKSCELASSQGPYSSFQGSPLSEGKFQFDLWGDETPLCGLWDWETLRKRVMKQGARNSLLVALMPTASTSQIMGNNECIEPYTSNIYSRRTLAGEFTVVNKHLTQDLVDLNLWNQDNKDRLCYYRGSVQNLKGLPDFLKRVYKTVWEIKQKTCIQLTRDRSPFVCQSQSLNLWFDNPDFKKLTAAHFFGWKQGLKTGSYYIRTKPAVESQQFGLDARIEKKYKEEEDLQCLNCSA